MELNAIVIAGGRGTRLWPVSRASLPKQFHTLHGDKSLLQNTLERLSGLKISSTTILCNSDHRFHVAEQLREIDFKSNIILEPVCKNTAPAIALAANHLKGDPLMLILSSDHLIHDKTAFFEAINSAIPIAEKGKIVTFGVYPTSPNTEYGYIKKGEPEGAGYSIEKFAEKPSLELAQTYFESNEFFWNSGIFLVKKSCFLEELRKFQPKIFYSCQESVEKAYSDLDFVRVDSAAFDKSPNLSVDIAVMEKTSIGFVMPLGSKWSDIGSWNSLWENSEQDNNGNVIQGDVLSHDTGNSLLRTEDTLLCTLGVKDMIIVATKDAIMVADKQHLGAVNKVIEKLKSSFRPELENHRKVYRPWGSYDSISKGDSYQVKKIIVNPGAKLSLQMHHHRSEHWIITSGVAKVTLNDKNFLLNENESTFIPMKAVHSIENPGQAALELIEVQCGSYLGEDDIVRFNDIYGRADV